MREEENYTEKVICELIKKDYNYSDSIKLIREKYRLRGFTLIGIKKEKRYLNGKLSDNTCNTFDVISGLNASALCGVIIFRFLDSFKKMNIIIKLLLPILVTMILISVFLSMVAECREKVSKYRLCLDVLDEIQDKLEGDCLVALNREIVQEELELRSKNSEESCEIDLINEELDGILEESDESIEEGNLNSDIQVQEDEETEIDFDNGEEVTGVKVEQAV